MDRKDIDLIRARLLVQRLGRLSADSVWAHQASGVRASLDKFLARLDSGEADPDQLEPLLKRGSEILEKAAQTIPSPLVSSQNGCFSSPIICHAERPFSSLSPPPPSLS